MQRGTGPSSVASASSLPPWVGSPELDSSGGWPLVASLVVASSPALVSASTGVVVGEVADAPDEPSSTLALAPSSGCVAPSSSAPLVGPARGSAQASASSRGARAP
jgi:hypothetical protein